MKINFLFKKHLPLTRQFAKSHFLFFLMHTGIVKFYNESKGFGFIVDNASGKEIFVHASGLINNIQESDKVTFEVQDGRRGLNAVNVKIA